MTLILVSGALANKPLNGGEAWVRLNWVLGLRKLGFQVYFVEQIGRETCVKRPVWLQLLRIASTWPISSR